MITAHDFAGEESIIVRLRKLVGELREEKIFPDKVANDVLAIFGALPGTIADREGPWMHPRHREKGWNMITAHDFVGHLPGEAFAFGVNEDSVVAGLRKLIGMIEEGKILPKEVIVQSEAKQDDFTKTTISLEIYEKRNPG